VSFLSKNIDRLVFYIKIIQMNFNILQGTVNDQNCQRVLNTIIL